MPHMPTSKEVTEALEMLKALMSKTPFTYDSVVLTETAVQDILQHPTHQGMKDGRRIANRL